MRKWFPVVALLASACGGSPTQPPKQPPVVQPPPQAQTWTITGTVTATLTAEPIAGALLNFSNQTATTNSAGRWMLTGSGTLIAGQLFGVEVSAPGYLTRKTGIRAESGRDVAVDLIRDVAPFNLGFYRQLIRNDFDTPGQLLWTRRWTVTPNFYINTFNPRTGTALLPSEVDLMVRTIREAVPQATGGAFQAGNIETGQGDRPQQTNYINIEILYEPDGNFCGRAEVGANPGRLWMNYDRCASECGAERISPRTLSHEVGHAMGFWHHGSGGIMDSTVQRGICGLNQFSEQERYHARILYARPVGNADVDWDQPSTPLLKAFLSQPAPVVNCLRKH